MRKSLLQLGVLAVAVGGALVASAAPAAATPICVEVDVFGLLVEQHPEPVCVSYGGPVNCHTPHGGVDPWIHVDLRVCIPV